MNPAEPIADDQRRRLLEAMPRAVAQNGFEGASVGRIVKLAQVRRNAFYEQFADKGECFSLAYEAAQERLLGVLTYRCYTQRGLAERVGAALGGALDLLSDPVLSRFLLVEAPAAGKEMVARHHEWLDRYGRMLHLAAIGSPGVAAPPAGVEAAVVGGIASRARQMVLAGRAEELASLCPELVGFALSFYGTGEPPPVSTSREDDSAQPQSPGSASVLEPV